MPQLSDLRMNAQYSQETSKGESSHDDDWVKDTRFSVSRAEIVEQKLAALQNRASVLLNRQQRESN
jgi:hypothetical protein